MTWLDVATLVALLGGPAIAVFITRSLDDRRAQRERRMDIFRTLMRTRRTPMWLDHVGALNLVEIEFSKNNAVIEAWKQLSKHLGTEHPRRPDEQTNAYTNQDDIAKIDQRYFQRLSDERQRLLAKLLHAIARSLNFKIEQLEIFEGGYIPQGWNDMELEQAVMRRLAMDIMMGKRVLPVGVL